MNLNIDFGSSKDRKSYKQAQRSYNVCRNYCACAYNILSFDLLCVNGNAKIIVYLLNGTQYSRPNIGDTQYARPK